MRSDVHIFAMVAYVEYKNISQARYVFKIKQILFKENQHTLETASEVLLLLIWILLRKGIRNQIIYNAKRVTFFDRCFSKR